ncbi:MAG: c-type cytochrome [Burkholderiales bacterium]|jgi:cytochrome c553
MHAPAAPPPSARTLRAARRVVTRGLALALLAAGVPSQVAHAQSARAATAPPSPPDTLDARLLACTGCHGPQGRSTPDGYYPRIAGKPAGYLYNQLLNFRDGRRAVPSMTWMVDGLPDAYLRDIAAHFAGRHPPHPPSPPPAAPPATLERGRRLVLEGDRARELPACVACHGDALLGAQPAVPGLLGLPRDYLNAQFGAWREGTRRAMAPDCMATIARRLAPDDVAAITAWLAAQPVPADARARETLPATLPLECGGLGR